MGQVLVVSHAGKVVPVPVLQLGPVSSRIVRICGRTIQRLTNSGNWVTLTIPEGTEAPRLGPAGAANLTVAPLSTTEKAEVAELRALRSALYGDAVP
jgi:gamma-glutamylcysteine synthetase